MRFLFVALLVVGCAKRTYLTPGGVGGGNKAEALEKCVARFSSGTCVSLAWEKMPTEDEVGSFLFKTFRPNVADSSPVLVDLPGTMTVVLWMPSMGHGSSPVSVRRLDVGTFQASEVFFSMKGVWDIRIELTDGTNDQAVIPITL